ncbi:MULTISPECIES: oligosaccharide flippase family protein [unclassified Pigmentiphaga]|uniref:oligosaccharide flippase family protein n=2 Tax=unclassified Pigmentiphaga TaxID=2626614 RepID=UPI000B408197|nr:MULTISPECIES: oligosaccharide flippase family protein [unclassified Pigmentiphaga]OVZ58149.1 hypothetical protein CDO46_26925 [Pigmentiphaga sp. NML030171]
MRFDRCANLLRNPSIHSLAWLSMEKAVQLAFSFISIGIIARALGPQHYGEFQYVLAVLFIFSAVTLGCGAEVIAPDLVKLSYVKSRQGILGSALLIRLALGGVAMLLMATSGLFWFSGTVGQGVAIMALSLLIAEPFNILRIIRESASNTRVIARIRFQTSVLKLVAIAGVAALGGGVLSMLAIYLAETIVIAAAYVYLIADDGRPWDWRPTRRHTARLLRASVPVWLGLALMIGMQRMDRLVLGISLPPAIFGEYAAAMSLMDSVMFFGPVVMTALAPRLLYRHENLSIVARNAGRLLIILTCLGLAAVIGFYLFSGLLTTAIFGERFVQVQEILRAASWITVVGFFDTGVTALLVRLRYFRLIAAKWLGGFLVCFLVLWLGDRGEWLTGIAGLIAGYTTAASIGMGTVFFKLRKSRMGVRAL